LNLDAKTDDIEGDFKKFPEISEKSIQGLKARGINYLFPV